MEAENGQEQILKILQEFAIRDQMDKLERYRVLNQDVKKGQILLWARLLWSNSQSMNCL